jgi:alkylhydroperoxidase family enzyme
MQSHAAAARELYKTEGSLVDSVLNDMQTAPLTEKMKALLIIADKVRQDGRLVTSEDIELARNSGADDKAIHDTVLIAAAFCMYNRYVDGLGTWAPAESEAYKESGVRLATRGYL